MSSDASDPERRDVVLRPVGPADAPLFLELARAFHDEDGHPLTSAAEAAVDDLCLGDPLYPAWFLVVQGAVAGYVSLALGFSLEFGGRDGFIDDLFVVPAFRGRGVGRRVIALVEIEAASRGVRMLHLEVEAANHRAYELYGRCGFEDSGRRLMSKALRPTGGPRTSGT